VWGGMNCLDATGSFPKRRKGKSHFWRWKIDRSR
jgi:hypothetical protein